MNEAGLTAEQLERYKRQLPMQGFGREGQKKLLESRVFVLGAGGLGSSVLMYLAAAGVGTIGVADSDTVELSNLNRQVIHANDSIGVPKTQSAALRMKAFNPDVNVIQFTNRITPANAVEVVSGFDVAVDCTDNFHTRYLLNDACALAGRPMVHGSVYEFEGQASTFAPSRGGPCYRCLFPEPPPPDLYGGGPPAILGALPGLIGCVEATEAVKLLLGIGETLIGRLLLCDAFRMRFREMNVRRNPGCPLCGENPVIKSINPGDPCYMA